MFARHSGVWRFFAIQKMWILWEGKGGHFMDVWELLLVGIGLSMDAFAASICQGLGMKKLNWRQGMATAFFFGGFQAAMPLLGWILGRQFEEYIQSVDHWIAFLLLGYIGGKMIWDAFHEEDAAPVSFDWKRLLVLAVATSIDALAVGVTFAFLQVSILLAVSLIGATTFFISLAGIWIGFHFGSRYKNRATLAGGVILCLIGLKILLEHLGYLG